MAERVLEHTASIPAGTPVDDPTTISVPFDNWDVERIDLEVPPGPAGCMGFQLANNGQPWVPRTVGEWLVWDDHTETIYPTGYPNASGWQVIGYNVGLYAHAVIVRFHVNAPTVAASAPQPVVITFVERDVPPLEQVVL